MHITEPEKKIPVVCETDVVVCGGGPAGFCAAIESAREGAKTVLLEQYGFLGGAYTKSGINGIGGWQHDLNCQPLIDGIPGEIMKRMADNNAADPYAVNRAFNSVEKVPDYINYEGLGCIYINTTPEYFKILADEMVEEAGVSVFYHTSASAPIIDENILKGVIIESKSGREAIIAKTVIDCTGDGDIAFKSGASYEIGRKSDGACQPHTMLFTVGNTGDIYLCYDKNNPETDVELLVRGRYKGAVAEARKRGEIKYNPNDIFCSATPVNNYFQSVKNINFTRIQNLSGVDREELTQAEIIGRKQVKEGLAFMRKYIKNCEDACLVGIPPVIGIRESRRIMGDYILTKDDIEKGTRFYDVIARGIYLMDIHNPTEVGKPSVLQKLKQPYDIPYRCLLPKGIENLLVAGRCISGDSEALSSYRIQSHCMAMGEAAGRAAALAARTECSVRDINVKQLQKTLKKAGVNIGR